MRREPTGDFRMINLQNEQQSIFVV